MKTLKLVLLGLVGLLLFYGIRQEFRAIPTVELLDDASDREPTKLRVLLRHGYFSPELLAEAEASLGVTFQVSYYFSDDQCWRLLESVETWDLMLVPDLIALRLDRLNRTYDINYERIPNHRNMMVSMPMPQEMGALLRCSVPLFYTAIGIGYDTRFVGSIPLTWNALFQPANAGLLRGHLGLLNEPRRCLGIALIALGLSPNTTQPAEIKLAAEHVRKCMALIAAMDRSAESVHGGAAFLAQEAIRQKVFLTMITSAAISRAMETNPGLRFSSPVEGTLLCIDCLIIPRNSQDRTMAEACINFLLQPRISAQLTNESGFATTNEAATAYFDPQLYHGPAFAFPTGKQFFFLQDVGEAEALYQAAWHDLLAYYQANVAPVIDRELGFNRTFIESNDHK
jgi:spermidine/putrescine transport system substrate-binding protein